MVWYGTSLTSDQPWPELVRNEATALGFEPSSGLLLPLGEKIGSILSEKIMEYKAMFYYPNHDEQQVPDHYIQNASMLYFSHAKWKLRSILS